MSLGEKIKKYRNEKGLTQDELSDLAEISKNALWNYENDKRSPTYEILLKLSKALNISIEKLVGSKKPKKEYNFDFNKIIDRTYDIFEEIYYHDKIWADRNDPLSPKEFHQKDKYFILEAAYQVKNILVDKTAYQHKKYREGMLNEKKSQVDDSNIKNISYAKNSFDKDSRGGIVESANQFELGNKKNDKQYLKYTIEEHEEYLMNVETVEGWKNYLEEKIKKYKIKLENVEEAGESKDNYKIIEEDIKSAHKKYLSNKKDDQPREATQKDIDQLMGR